MALKIHYNIARMDMRNPIILSKHAFYRLQLRNISEKEVISIIEDGIIIEAYPDDQPYPSRLLYGCIKGKHLHVVAAYDRIAQREIIITTYEPAPEEWDAGFKTRRTP